MGLRDSLAYLAYGPGHGSTKRASSSSAQIIPFPTQPQQQPQRSSWAFDSHIVTTEAASGGGGFNRGKSPQTVSMAWDERDAWGLDLASRNWQGVTPVERKEILLGVYINIPAVSSCVDVIAKRIFSGGFTVEKIDEEGKDNQAHYDQLMEFCLRVNPDWDFNQYGRSSIQDQLIYGESYAEIVWKNGLPYNLIKVDCITMGFRANRFGQIERYYQQMPSTQKINYLDVKNIIRWWFPHPRASIDPFAPSEKVSDATLLSKKMVNWMITFFQKGAKFPHYYKFPGNESEADRFLTWADQNIHGAKNAHRPPTTWGGTEIVPMGNAGSMDMDFQKGEDRQDIIIYGAYGVPPMAVSVVKTGALGGSIGEDEDKAFIFNACNPVKEQWLEKLNFRIVQQGFNIHDYKIGARYADYRSDQNVSKVEDTRIRNGSRTINEIRQESGRRPYKIGGDVAIVVASKDVFPVPRFDGMEDEQAVSADLDNQTKAAQLENIKNPPQPPALPAGQTGQLPQAAKQQAAKAPEKPAKQTDQKTTNNIAGKTKQAKEDAGQHNTGMMLAFMLDAKTAEQLVIPGGEPASEMHITLAYLGDTEEEPEDDGLLRAHLSPDKIRDAVAGVASQSQPMTGKVQGIGRFGAPDGEPTPVYAAPDVSGLAEFRTKLVTAVQAAGYYVAKDHDFTPHITLAYIDASAPMPMKDIPALALVLDTVSLVIGDNQYDFKLKDERQSESEEQEIDDPDATQKLPVVRVPKLTKSSIIDSEQSQEDYNPKTGAWEPPDIDQHLSMLREKGVATQTWNAHAGACSELCMPNDGQTVKVGESFKMGQRSVNGHPHCVCEGTYRDAEGKEIKIKDENE